MNWFASTFFAPNWFATSWFNLTDIIIPPVVPIPDYQPYMTALKPGYSSFSSSKRRPTSQFAAKLPASAQTFATTEHDPVIAYMRPIKD